ncbi:hypothetical protein [Streptomyces fuscigenes]|uniref:hypothetical protein n=1 Tax=Streptomyces fuscigenes TaxID=1528880 RepID=UPI001F2213C0|nr:hypothetical protein [Streptomyces fuscigenes]MCF3960224.1 hypothetical protein [Streptomyces fuscigenes]
MRQDVLGIYLNDHLAGATYGTALARRIARQHRGSPGGGDLERIAEEVAQDRQSLLRIMERLDVPVRGYKIYGGMAAEKLSRLKPNGVIYRRSGLSFVIELETLRLGVEGKSLVWRTLLTIAPGDSRLDTAELNGLLQRARDQIETLSARRLAAAERIFGQGRRCITATI